MGPSLISFKWEGLLKNLIVYPEAMRANMEKTRGLFYSQRILLELTRKGLSREDAYRMVQRSALAAWDEKEDFLEKILRNREVTDILPEVDIRKCCTLEIFCRHIDEIFERVFKEGKPAAPDAGA